MRRWIGLATALVAVLALIFLVTSLGRVILGALNAGSVDAGAGADPMFAEPAEQVTRPPELAGSDADAGASVEDRSDSWVYEELTPVDKTAQELAGETAN